jgi:hypothetical protein
MYRKRVRLDPNNGESYSEIDPVALQRTTQALREFALNRIDPLQDPYNIRGTVLELCEGVMNGTEPLPMNLEDDRLNFMNNMDRFELMPTGLSSLWGEFAGTAYGARVFADEDIIEVDGERYAYMDFEEPGDWPDVVKQREKDYWADLKRQVAEDERLASQKKQSSA